MALKFYKDTALPANPTATDDGIWFIKQNGDHPFKIYVIDGGQPRLLDSIEEAPNDGKPYIRKSAGWTKLGGQIFEMELNPWNMDSLMFKNLPHGLSASEWKTVRVLGITIRNDADTLTYSASGIIEVTVSSVYFIFTRTAGDKFDNANFDNTSSFNRGWITFTYEPDTSKGI